jgi:hypothetical protein
MYTFCSLSVHRKVLEKKNCREKQKSRLPTTLVEKIGLEIVTSKVF